MNGFFAALCVVTTSLFLLASVEGAEKANTAVLSAESKLKHIQRNGADAHPDPSPTQLTESELNAYLASDALELPAGVESVRLEGAVGNVVGRARVDFDKVRAGTKNPSPLLSLFTGVHDVVVTAEAQGSLHQGVVRVERVWFDGSEIPRFVVQMFAEKYLAPRYHGVGMESKFPLPHRIESAVVGQHVLTVVQK
jgi:hypothetical protein